MKLAVLAGADPMNVRTWSGTPYFMTKALQTRYPDLVPVRTPRPVWHQYVRRAIKRASAGRLELFWNQRLARWTAQRLAEQLEAQQVDVVVCIGNAPLSAFLASHIATVHVSDATVPLMRDFYSEFSRLPGAVARSAIQLDSQSVLRSRACLFATEWAARSAIDDYSADPSRVHAIPWGANITDSPPLSAEWAASTDVCHLVFIGVDWVRKGGANAVATAALLSDAGRPVRLHVIGTTPKGHKDGQGIELHGFINKGTEQGFAEFDRLMRQASFLFVPTRQDCYGMVFPEASAYGVPIITTSTGGVPDVVREGVNGHLLPLDATADAYADLIWKTWTDRPHYDRLRRSSRARFESTLNWTAWLAAAAPIIENAAAEGRWAER